MPRVLGNHSSILIVARGVAGIVEARLKDGVLEIAYAEGGGLVFTWVKFKRQLAQVPSVLLKGTPPTSWRPTSKCRAMWSDSPGHRRPLGRSLDPCNRARGSEAMDSIHATDVINGTLIKKRYWPFPVLPKEHSP